MVIVMKLPYTIILLFTFAMSLSAQRTLLYPEFGYSQNWNKKAGGYALSLNFQIKTGEREAIGIEIGQVYTEGAWLLPNDYVEQGNYNIGTVDQPAPLQQFANSRSDFPALSLSSATDRYFNFNFALKQMWMPRLGPKSELLLGLGAVFSFREEKGLVKWVEINGSGVQDHAPYFPDEPFFQPIYQMDIYWDLGAMLEAGYRYQLSERMFLQGGAKAFYFPPSGNWLSTATAAVGFWL